jgi:carbon-monoxide dehydrogenase medium subunit
LRTFEFFAPAMVEEAIALLDHPDTRALAGGTDLIVQMRERRREVGRVVDLKRIPEFVDLVEEPGGGVRIGAAMNVTAMARNEAMARYPSLLDAARMIGSYQIQNRAGIGGNICNAAPSADAVPALMCLGARAAIAGPSGRRDAAIETLFAGPGKTTMAPQELLVSVNLPPPPPRSAGAYLRFTPRREMDIAITGVGTWLRLAEDGRIAEARIALAAVAPTPLRAEGAESRLAGEHPSTKLLAEAGILAAREARPISDTRGSADYRRELVKLLTSRALATCLAQLGRPVEVA